MIEPSSRIECFSRFKFNAKHEHSSGGMTSVRPAATTSASSGSCSRPKGKAHLSLLLGQGWDLLDIAETADTIGDGMDRWIFEHLGGGSDGGGENESEKNERELVAVRLAIVHDAIKLPSQVAKLNDCVPELEYWLSEGWQLRSCVSRVGHHRHHHHHHHHHHGKDDDDEGDIVCQSKRDGTQIEKIRFVEFYLTRPVDQSSCRRQSMRGDELGFARSVAVRTARATVTDDTDANRSLLRNISRRYHERGWFLMSAFATRIDTTHGGSRVTSRCFVLRKQPKQAANVAAELQVVSVCVKAVQVRSSSGHAPARLKRGLDEPLARLLSHGFHASTVVLGTAHKTTHLGSVTLRLPMSVVCYSPPWFLSLSEASPKMATSSSSAAASSSSSSSSSPSTLARTKSPAPIILVERHASLSGSGKQKKLRGHRRTRSTSAKPSTPPMTRSSSQSDLVGLLDTSPTKSSSADSSEPLGDSGERSKLLLAADDDDDEAKQQQQQQQHTASTAAQSAHPIDSLPQWLMLFDSALLRQHGVVVYPVKAKANAFRLRALNQLPRLIEFATLDGGATLVRVHNQVIINKHSIVHIVKS
jgi:hypothetical protein